jgi:5-methylcytosine-specific restriction endonuclease McrA
MTEKRDYKKEYARYQGTPEQIHKRSLRNQARREMEKRGLVHKGDGKDVDHKHPIDRGGDNRVENLRVLSRRANRGYRRDSRNNPI